MDEKNDEKKQFPDQSGERKQFSEELGQQKQFPKESGDQEEKKAEIERRVVKDLQNQYFSPQLDEVWCLIDAKWFKWWKEWTSFEAKSQDTGEPIATSNTSRPGPIDNSHLLEEGRPDLRKNLIQNEDYEIIHETVWDTLCDWYEGFPAIRRYVIERGVSYNKQNVVNLHPIFLKWGYADDSQPDGLPKEENRKVIQVIRTMEMKKLRECLKEKDVDPDKPHTDIRLNMPLGVINSIKRWFVNPTDEDKKRFIEVLPEQDLTDLEECDFTGYDLHVVVSQEVDNEWSFKTPKPYQYRLGEMYDIRDRNKNHFEGFIREITDQGYKVHFVNWNEKYDEFIPVGEAEQRFFKRSTYTSGPHKRKTTYTTDAYSYSGGYNSNEKGASTTKGIVGLRNLGNTCFMNSTLQCLMQSPGLSDFFIDGPWKKDINRENALGKNGRVAEQYGALVRTTFSNEYRVIAPREFKKVIGEFAPQFMGYQQQDSQELLAFLLDGLHEDMNRIKVKPYVENKESDGREDNLVAEETWEMYKMRNNSIIVDLLQGQYKSKLKCPTCQRTSITFDPFMYLTVPLPTEKFKIQPVTFVKGDGTIKKYGIKVSKNGDVADLKIKIGSQFDVDPKWLVCADVWKQKVHTVCKDSAPVIHLRGTVDVWAYYAPPSTIAAQEKQETTGDEAKVESKEAKAESKEAKAESKESKVESKEDEALTRYFHCPINSASKGAYTYSLANPVGIPPLFITISENDELSHADVFNKICDLLKFYGFWKPDEEGGENLPFTINYTPERNWGYYSNQNEKELKRIDDKFKITTKVKFSVFWNREKRHEAEIEKDASFPEEGENRGEETVDLSSCLSAFTEEEVLTKENAWYCNKCKEFQMASKKMELWRLPDLLVIHLKRFSFNRRYRNKISSLVKFPLKDLDLKDWISPNCKLDQTTKYDLYGASMHSGGLGGGHYTAYAQSVVSNEWYYLNDSSVSRADAKSTQSPCAYLLFYKRQHKGQME